MMMLMNRRGAGFVLIELSWLNFFFEFPKVVFLGGGFRGGSCPWAIEMVCAVRAVTIIDQCRRGPKGFEGRRVARGLLSCNSSVERRLSRENQPRRYGRGRGRCVRYNIRGIEEGKLEI